MKNSYGICEWYLALNGPSAVKLASQMGYDGIQLGDLGGARNNFPMLDKRIQEEYLETAYNNGIKLQALHTFTSTRDGGMQYPIESPEGEQAIISFKKAVRICTEMSIPTVMVASYGASNFHNEYEMKNTGAMLKLFSAIAQEQSIGLAYEGFAIIDKLLWIQDYVGSGLKFCYDTLNPIRFGTGDPLIEIPMIGIESIDHVHVKDAPVNMTGCCPLGEGNGGVEETINLLKKLGYKGWYVAENYYYLPPMSAMGHGIDLAKKDLATLKKICE